MTSAEVAAERPGGWSVLWGIAGAYRSRMILLGVASFGGAMLEAGFLVLLTSTVIALAAGRNEVGPVLGQSIPVDVALIVAAAAIIVRLVLSLATVRISARLGALVRTGQRRRVSRAYLRASWKVQQGEAAGSLQELLTSFVGRINGAMSALTQAITASLSLLAFMAAGVVVDPVATVVVLGALGVLGIGLAPVRRRIRKQAATSATTDLRFATTLAELGSLGQEMQTFGVRGHFEDRLDRVTVETTESARRVQVLSGTLSPVYTFLAYGAVIAVVAALRILGVGDLTAIGAVMLLMLRSLSYGQQLLAVSGALAASLPSLERVDDVVGYYEENRASSGTSVPSAVTPLEFADVSFEYTEDRPALSGVTCQIETGEMIGVIGPSGAGKSTFAQLILGLRDPSEGAVLAAGIDLRTIDRDWWTRRVAFVPQDAVLFTGTVAENIRFFRDGISDAAIDRATVQANLTGDISRLPDGFDTHLGERGSQLSGGQRQRLSIARALVAEPELLILDEPTSALDGQTEALIRQTLADLRTRMTVVIIAHRMSTLDLCDRIMVIEGGRMTAFDTPQALRQASPFYTNALKVAGIA